MKLSKSIVENMPKSTVRQVRKRQQAQAELKRAETIVRNVEDRFQSVMRTDNRFKDENEECGQILRVDGKEVTIANVTEDGREFYDKNYEGSASYTKRGFASITYSSAPTYLENEISENGDRAVFSQRKSYDDWDCPYPNDNVSVVRDTSSGEPVYQIYDSWLFSKLAKAGVL